MAIDRRPIIGFDGTRGSRVEWDELDRQLAGAHVVYRRVSTGRDGVSETVTRVGTTADGRRFRTKEFYSV